MQNPTVHSYLGLGAMALNALTYVQNPPGAYFVGEYKGEKQFVISCFEFGNALGINSHHIRYVKLMFDNMLNLGLIRAIENAPSNYSALQGSVLITLPAPAKHTPTQAGKLAEVLASNGKGELNDYGKDTFEAYISQLKNIYLQFTYGHWLTGHTGFDDTRMWDNVDAVTKAYDLKGSAGLKDDSWPYSWGCHFEGLPQPSRGIDRYRETQRARAEANRHRAELKRRRESASDREAGEESEITSPVQEQSRRSGSRVQTKSRAKPQSHRLPQCFQRRPHVGGGR